ncbi:hypothetical protein [Micromonospora solifontis]|uniref:DivIVA domain-containing protein n=1 Tax=Micromonospora TaxID=1873 RepID=UPI0018F4303B
MNRPATSLSALLVGLGVGAVGGAQIGAAAVWPGVAVGVAGVALAFFRSSPDAVSDETAAQSTDGRPTLSGLGTRVEQILRLAERQADDHRATAEREAERILSEARATARLIVDRAHADAAGTTETANSGEVRGTAGDGLA